MHFLFLFFIQHHPRALIYFPLTCAHFSVFCAREKKENCKIVAYRLQPSATPQYVLCFVSCRNRIASFCERLASFSFYRNTEKSIFYHLTKETFFLLSFLFSYLLFVFFQCEENEKNQKTLQKEWFRITMREREFACAATRVTKNRVKAATLTKIPNSSNK